ncbi:MAG: hypothetical protein HY235_24410 [Acidobacteria bacterium]|nr:hypothetical protein [Acidobacteriota bacterium]
MTRRLVFGLILAAAVAMPAPWPFGKKSGAAKTEKAKTEGFDSQYTGGTVAAIPQYTNGKLDLSDPSELRFHYGKPTWSAPYSKIVSIEVADKQPNPWVTIPKVQRKKRIVTILYQGEKATRQQTVFELSLHEALQALPLLEERAGKPAYVAGMSNADGWWGDRYWKTQRNTQVWDDVTGQKGVVAQKQ